MTRTQRTAAHPAARPEAAGATPRRGEGARCFALLLRGVNVGRGNSLPMATLRAMLEELGCSDVATYVQSGNAVFRTTLAGSELAAAIEGRLAEHMGRPVPTALRTGAELDAVIAGNPFAGVATNGSSLCVTFLSVTPEPAELAALRDRDWAPDLLHVATTEIYSWYPDGQGRSRLATELARLPVRGAATTRNWNTVTKLRELLSAIEAGPPGSSPG